MKSGWPVKAFELFGLGSTRAFRERHSERERSDSMCKEYFHEDFWLWRYPEQARRDSERTAAHMVWQRWRWTYQKHPWAVMGRLIPWHKWLPLGTCGIHVAEGKVLTFVAKWVWLALDSVHGRWLFWEIMPQVSDLIMYTLETFYHTWDNSRLKGQLLEESSVQQP